MDKPVKAANPSVLERKQERAARLAAELRANLKRRKAAARGREAGEAGPQIGGESSDYGPDDPK